MAVTHHHLLNIKDLAALKAATDSYIAAQYEAAKLEIIRQGLAAEQLIALDNAFAALKTTAQRAEYIIEHEAKASTHAAHQDAAVYVVDSKHVPELKKLYAAFVRNHYREEPNNTRFRPEEYHFANREQFESSEVYKKASEADRDNILNGGFPCKVVGFQFKNRQDADKFRNDMIAKGFVQTAQPTSAPRMGR